MVALEDPDGNVTAWQYNGLGEVTVQTNALAASEYYYYNAGGQLTGMLDARGRATTYQYNAIGQETGESWYAASNTSGTPDGDDQLRLQRGGPAGVGNGQGDRLGRGNRQLHL